MTDCSYNSQSGGQLLDLIHATCAASQPIGKQTFRYRVCWENAHGERFYSDELTNSTEIMRLAKHCVREGRKSVRILMAFAGEEF